MINYQTLLKNVLVRVRYTNWLLRTTTNMHKKFSSAPYKNTGSLLYFRSLSSVWRIRKVTYNHSGLSCLLVNNFFSLSKKRTAAGREVQCPGLNANEIQIPYDEHHKVSSLVKSHQNTHNSVRYEVI